MCIACAAPYPRRQAGCATRARRSMQLSFAGMEANSILQCPSLHSAFPEPLVFSSMRESGRLYLEKCAQALKESGAIFTLLGRLILGEMSIFDDALGLHLSFCQ